MRGHNIHFCETAQNMVLKGDSHEGSLDPFLWRNKIKIPTFTSTPFIYCSGCR